MVAHRRKISTAASAVVATMFVISKSIRKKMLIEKAVTDRHMIMNIRHIRKAETSFEDDSASLIQYLKKLFISFIAERLPIYCNAPSTKEEKVTAIAIAIATAVVISVVIVTSVVISVVIVTAVVIVTKIVTETVIAIVAAVETVTTIVILCRILNVLTWLREITLQGLWRVHLK